MAEHDFSAVNIGFLRSRSDRSKAGGFSNHHIKDTNGGNFTNQNSDSDSWWVKPESRYVFDEWRIFFF
jgi:hypothetical protein